MSHVFISYARSTGKQAQQVAAVLRGLGREVWLDDAIPAHRAYAEVIEERSALAQFDPRQAGIFRSSQFGPKLTGIITEALKLADWGKHN